jgi:hypothetical protein
MKSRSKLMLEKSIASMLSAIEVYNKPDFKYREETFSVLCINSWELLLKSKVLNLSGNKMGALIAMKYKKLKDGGRSKIKHRKKNRSGNPMSISLFEAYRVITEDYGVKVNKAVHDNLISITEIRDNSIHYVNDDLLLAIKIQELGTASLQNYFHLVSDWFGNVLGGYNFYLMPLSFFRGFDIAKGISLNTNEKKLLEFIKSREKEYDEGEDYGDYNLTLKIDVKFQKVKSDAGLPILVTNDPSAQMVQFSEEDISDRFPWDYDVLTTRLRKRYSDFKMNPKYHRLRKELEGNKKLAHVRYLNPSNPNGGKKTLYSTNIQKEFDKHYAKNS